MPVVRDNEYLYIGRICNKVVDADAELREARVDSFDFITIPISASNCWTSSEKLNVDGSKEPTDINNPEYCDAESIHRYHLIPTTVSDLIFDSKTWSSCIVGELSKWINPDGQVPNTPEYYYHCDALERELKWATHLGLSGILISIPLNLKCVNYARILNSFLMDHNINVMIKIPLSHKKAKIDEKSIDSNNILENWYADDIDGWEIWNNFRIICDYSPLLSIAIEFTDFPSSLLPCERWRAEPVKSVIIPTSLFLTNSNNFPVLPKIYKNFLLQLFENKIQVILKPEESDSAVATNREGSYQNQKDELRNFKVVIKPYLNYIMRLFQSIPLKNEDEKFEHMYQDYLQSPLQPLQDNLESQIYETFERDPVKYKLYEEALLLCLCDKFKEYEKNCDKKGIDEFCPVIMVVGAGRGPLVEASLKAIHRANIKRYEVYAIERNENALITLEARVHYDKNIGWRNVKVVGSDMRYVQLDVKADIIVSELLGSFSDNELSPECLDGVQRFLKSDGTFLPHKYTSYLEPISSNKLWNDLRQRNNFKAYESTYVTKLHSVFYPSLERATPCFEFKHPNPYCDKKNDPTITMNHSKLIQNSKLSIPDTTFNYHNNRQKSLKFKAICNVLIHGFVGYFSCHLYGDIIMSIVPGEESKGMFSWFPLLLPLANPIYVKRDDIIEFNIWRCSDERRVWYEWCVSSPQLTLIYNPCGRSHYMGK